MFDAIWWKLVRAFVVCEIIHLIDLTERKKE
jgi:hypothetical protein